MTLFPVITDADGEFATALGKLTIHGVLRDDGNLQSSHQKRLWKPDGYGATNFRERLTRHTDDVSQIDRKPLAGANLGVYTDMVATRLPKA